MKILKQVLAVSILMLGMNVSCLAASIGYADFEKIISEYTFARNAYKELDSKNAELRQYALDKEKQFKTIESPLKKKNFEEQVQKEFADKAEKINTLTVQKEKVIRDNILSACKSVAAAKKLDAVLDSGVVYAGRFPCPESVPFLG